jgi:hypothetical protein
VLEVITALEDSRQRRGVKSEVTNVPEVLLTGDVEEDRHASRSHFLGTEIFINLKGLH